MEKRRILITGASGNIGSKLIKPFKNKYELILLDRRRLENENIICTDLKEYDDNLAKHFENISTVIHLAGNANNNAHWKELIPDNIDAVLNVCHACSAKRVKRLVFASSCHTMGGYKDKNIELITTDMEPLPDSDYGISKLIGERIGKSFSDRNSISVICLRIGWVPRSKIRPNMVINPWLRSLWLSDRDLIQIFDKSIEARGITFKILYAMSNNKGINWDIATTIKTLNYEPQDSIDLLI